MFRFPYTALYFLIFLVTANTSTPSLCDSNTYSSRMANSMISRGQAIAPDTNTEPEPSVYLQVGVFQTAVLRLLEYCAPPEGDACKDASNWEEYLKISTDSLVPWLGNASRDTGYPLDRFSTGRGLLHQYNKNQNPKSSSKTTLEALYKSTTLQPQNAFGGYWYFTYPQWSYLDGMYSLIPFLTYYTDHFHNDKSNVSASAVADNIIHQLDLLWTHCHQKDTGLLVHAYDASKTASWADPVTGASSFVWDRALGWYFMGLIDTLELVSVSSAFPERLERYLRGRFFELADAVSAAADPDSGCWWQVMEYPGREGNYIESSGSAMFAYTLYKGARMGYLSDSGSGAEAGAGRYTNLADKCYGYLVREFVVENDNGTLGYNGTVGVCSMDSEATYEYYVSQPLLYNSLHGTAAFTMASFEHEMLHNDRPI